MLKVIIIDDEKIILKGMMKIINWESLGYTIIGAYTNVSLAINKALENPPDVIITDIVMPGKDGLELIRILKEKLPSIKFIVLSAYDLFEYARKALKYGAYRYMLKPIDKNELIEILNEIRYLEKRNEQDLPHNQIMDDLISDTNTINEVIKYITTNYRKKELKLNSIAEKYYINYSYLSFMFKKVTGVNFNEYLLNIRMEEAKKLLVNTNLSIKEIARYVGYSGKNFFPAFKKQFGISPNALRKELKQEKEKIG
ncbi:MAG TPA: response regulator [Clostridiaceae bacterium]|nr:response regulator [Clostridiaceae bacterium]